MGNQLLMICKYLWSSFQWRRAQQTETIVAPPRWQSTKWWAWVLFCSHFRLFLFLLVFVHMCSGLGVPQREVRGQVHMPSKLNHQVLQVRDINVDLLISTQYFLPPALWVLKWDTDFHALPYLGSSARGLDFRQDLSKYMSWGRLGTNWDWRPDCSTSVFSH